MNFVNFKDSEIYSLAKPIMETMIEGTNASNYELFSTHFSAEMSQLVKEEKFVKQVNINVPKLGELGNYYLLGLIRRDSGVSVIYKQETTRTRSELLGQLFLNDEDGIVKVFDACLT